VIKSQISVRLGRTDDLRPARSQTERMITDFSDRRSGISAKKQTRHKGTWRKTRTFLFHNLLLKVVIKKTATTFQTAPQQKPPVATTETMPPLTL
jgi:hypothetical protein